MNDKFEIKVFSIARKSLLIHYFSTTDLHIVNDINI